MIICIPKATVPSMEYSQPCRGCGGILYFNTNDIYFKEIVVFDVSDTEPHIKCPVCETVQLVRTGR